MTVTLALTTEQERRLRQKAEARGVEADTLLGQMLQDLFERLEPEPAATLAQPRVLGLHAGQTWVSDDFDDPLPDSFWTGAE